MRKLLTILVYTFVVLLIGRNIVALPRFQLFSEATNYPKELKRDVATRIAKEKGNYGVYFYNLKDNTSFGINDEMTFTAASVNKVPIVAVLYNLSKNGKIDLEKQITLQESDIQDYGTGSLRYQKPGTTYSLRTLAKLALQQSDNTAAHILSDKIGVPIIQKTIAGWGLTQTDMENNRTTPKDMGLLFRKLYTYEVTSPPLTRELFGFMQNTDIEDRLPHLMPPGTAVYHKTGDAVGSLNDVGIITKDNQTFFLAVLTSDIGTDEQAAKTTIAEIARSILEFYAKRQ